MSRIREAALTLAALTILIGMCGCGQWFGAHKGHDRNAAWHKSLYAVKVEKTGFYEFGPMQARGPDRELPKDTLVTLIRSSSGYSKVKLDDGKTGFVANEDLMKAPERLIAEAEADNDDLPTPPAVALPTSPDVEPTPLPQPLMPQ